MASLIGGLQSSANPGRNLTPGITRPRVPRKPRVPRPPTPTVPRPNLGWGASGGNWAGAPPVTTYTPPPAAPPPAAPPAPWNNPWADPLHRGDPNWQARPGGATNPGPPPVVGPYVPPGAHARALPSAPASSLMSFDQYLANQPTWLAQVALDIANRNNLMAGYGFYKDAHGNLIADPKAAQDSVYAQLGLNRQRAEGHTAQQGANHGNLFSGASLMGVQNAADAFNTGTSHALQDLTGKIGGIDQHELDTKSGLSSGYTDYVGNTKTSSPEEFLKGIQSNNGHADNVATIDAYSKTYGKYLTPAQKAALAQERARQVTLYQTGAKAAQQRQQHPTTPKKQKRRRRRVPTHSVPSRTHNGGVAGGQGA